MIKFKYHAFSLIEILLCMTILALLAGTFVINGMQWVKERRFQSDLDHLSERIQLAYDLVLNYDTDVLLTFETNEKGLELSVNPDIDLAPSLKPFIVKKECFSSLRKVTFDSKNAKKAYLYISFFGTDENPLRLYFYPKNNSFDPICLCLNSFPHLIQRYLKEINTLEKAPYPDEVLQKKKTLSTVGI